MSSLPSTMRALLLTAKTNSAFSVSEHPLPALIPGHVIIRVHAAGVNPMDLKRVVMCNDDYPYIAGYDVAGVVEAVADDVLHLRPGDRVFGDTMANSVGPKSEGLGSIAQFCLSPAHILAKIPEDVSFVHAAAIPLVAMTAIQAFDHLGLKSGETVFVSGGAGGVGVHAMQIAHSYGVKAVYTTASAGKMEFVKQYGADEVVDYRKDDAGVVLKSVTDAALDCVGDLDTAKKVAKGDRVATIVDYTTDQFLMMTPDGKTMQRVAELLQSGILKVVIDSVYKLDDAPEAMKRQESGRAKGKIVVQVIE